VTGKRRGKTVSLQLRFTGGTIGTVTVRLRSGKKAIATRSGKPKAGRLTLTLRAKKAIRKGRYTIEASAGKTKLAPVALKLR
jgi:hypothetical protein